jgi:hypothetical protein
MNWDKKTLSEEEIEFLLDAPTDAELKRRVINYREQGFTVRDIAHAIDTPASTVHYWSASVKPPFKPPRRVIRSRAVEIDLETAERLREQAKRARRANRHTQSGTADALASENLTRMLKFLARERLVPIKTLAKAADVSSAAISQRIK